VKARRALVILVLSYLLCACGLMRSQPTPDAIATQAALLARRNQTLTPGIGVPDSAATPDLSVCELGASVVSETVAPGTIFRPGEEFTQTWEIMNTGTCHWGGSIAVTRREGDVLGAVRAVPLPSTSPGEVAVVSVPMRAPQAAGSYETVWQVCLGDSECADAPLRIRIAVAGAEATSGPLPTEAEPSPSVDIQPVVAPTETATLEPTPTPSPVPTDTPLPTDTPMPEATAVPTSTDTATPSPTPTPTETPAPTATPTSTNTATPTPTYTPSPTPTATSTPTVTPSPTPTSTPTVPPDQRQLAYAAAVSGLGQEVRLVQLDRSIDQNVTGHPENDTAPAWSPDGTRLAFASNREGSYDIFTISATGGRAQPLTEDPADENWPAWSPDGSRIAYIGGGQLCIVEVDGSDRRCIAPTAMRSPPAWSPDGTRLLYECGPDICVIGVDGRGQANLTNQPTYDTWPVWSPDGTKIAFVSGRDFNWEIYLMDAMGGDVRNLTRSLADDRWPAWSPDGRRVVFASLRGEPGRARWNIYVVNADGSDLRMLDTGNYARKPSWSPDGTAIAYYSDHDDVLGQVCVIRLDDGSMTCFGHSADTTGGPPAWRP